MNVTLLQPHVKQSGTYVFKQPIVPPGLVIHFYHWAYPGFYNGEGSQGWIQEFPKREPSQGV